MEWKRWRLFDPYLAPRDLVISAAGFRARTTDTTTLLNGFSLSAGQSISEHHSLLFAHAQVQYGFRFIEGGHWILSPFQYAYGAGFDFGPVELEARVGLGILDVHLGDGPIRFGIFSPRVGAGASLEIQKMRAGLFLYVEESWRLSGRPDLRMSGITLDFSMLGRPKGLPRFYIER